MKNYTSNQRILIGLLSLLILFSGKLSAQSEILGHTFLGTYDGHAYYISDCPTAWYDAYFAALEMGGYLAAITSQEEDDFLATFAPVIECRSLEYDQGDLEGGAWIGLLTNDNDQDGNCAISSWSNGESLGYTNWYQNSPEIEPRAGYCGPAAIIGYIGGNDAGLCQWQEYRWFTNYYTNPTSRYIVEFNQDPSCSNSNKTYVCHNGNTICVNNDAVQAHINHGDYAGPCGPCNSNALQVLPNNKPAITSQTLESADVTFTDPKVDQDIMLDISAPNQIQVYPNPASSEINIILPFVNHDCTVKIISLAGQEMKTLHLLKQQPITIDVFDFAAGFYLIDVRSSTGHYQKKFAKL